MAHQRTCTVCGAKYEYCKRCKQYEHLPTWMFAYCSENCRSTDLALNQYAFGHITAKECLDIVDTLKVKIANPMLANDYKNMKKEAKKSVSAKESKNEEAEQED